MQDYSGYGQPPSGDFGSTSPMPPMPPRPPRRRIGLLSYLGVGVPLSTVTWGGMLNEGKQVFAVAWWNALWPGLAILLTVFGTNLLGDGLSGEP